MSNYPYILDTILTLPTVSGTGQDEVAINALQEAVIAVETELGIKPSTPYSNVRVRLDILESRINFGVSPSIPNDGYVKSPLYINNLVQGVVLSISDGYGAPTENRLDGSLYMRADGYANNDFYIRRDGYWVPIQTEEWQAHGDLTGTHLFQTVIGLYNKPLRATMATVGATQDGYHITWNNVDGYWEAQTGFIPGRDLAIFSGPYGRTAQTVVGLQNRNLSSALPGGSTSSDGDGLAWDPSVNQWQPRPRAVIFDGYVARSNLKSNKTLQSPIDNTKTGVVNFSSRSSGVTAGATQDYAAILSGDKGTAAGNFGVIVGGESNTSNGQYSLVGNGLTNIAAGQYAIVLSGTLNTASQPQSFILDGYSNTVNNNNAFVLNGGNNQAVALFSGILNGLGHTINSGATHAGIGWGTANAIAGGGIYSIALGGNGNQVFPQYSAIINGNLNTISNTSNFSFIGGGSSNTISASSGFSFIGTGGNITTTGLYSTVINANTAIANGLHTTVINGNTNSVTATFSTIGNGNNNTISGNPAYATILDGYSNTVTGSGGLIVDGYSNTVNGIWSSIINGNNNSISGRNSTVLNGSSNILDAASSENTILVGTSNSHINSSNTVIIGSGNTLTNVNSHFILGSFNTHQSTFSFTNGSLNTSTAGASFNRVWGSSNTLNASTISAIFGNSNILGATAATSNNFIAGSSNTVDGYGNSTVLGQNNIAVANYSLVQGQYGKSRLFGQQVHANSRFTAGKIGEAQFSRVILSGTANAGGAITLQLQDTAPTNATFQDGYSYDMQIRVLIVNTAPISPNPVVPARFIFDVLAHQEGGTLVLDNINQTLVTPQNSGTAWSVTVSSVTNQLTITVDIEAGPPYVQPTNTPSNRRAVATIEMREMSRL